MDSCITIVETIPLSSRVKIAVTGIGLLVPVIVPLIHFGVIHRYWTPYKRNVDQDQCVCTCWDTIFKGSYQEWPPGYKHIYFNVTLNTLCAWTLTVLAVVGVYELTKHVVHLLYQQRARPAMVALLLLSLYPHYYSWWSYFNACNDDFYAQSYHQAVFTATELLSTLLVASLCDNAEVMQPKLLVVVLSVAVAHIVSSSWDQFLANVLYNQGHWHQRSRDVGFMLVDCAHILVPVVELVRFVKQGGHTVMSCVSRTHWMWCATLVLVIWGLCAIL